MKKNLISTIAVFFALALTACQPASGNEEVETSVNEVPSSETSTVESNHKHKYGEWTVVKAPTCTEKGSQERVCECGEKQTKDIDPLNHDWDEGTVTKAATCSVPGEKTYHCKRAGCTATKVEQILAEHDLQPVAHDKGEGEVTEVISKCSKDEYYQIEFNAYDAAATVNNASDKKSDYVKLSKQVAADGTGTASYIEWKIYSPVALRGRFWIDITGNTSNYWDRGTESGAQALYYTYNDTTTNINTWKNKVELNGEEVDFENASFNVKGEDIPFAKLVYSDFGELASSSGTPISVPMPEINLQQGVNTLRFTRLTGYAFNMHKFTFKTSL